MASNPKSLLVIPYKKAFDLNLSLPIKSFIESAYTVNVQEYLQSVDSLNQLRNEALFRASRQDKLNKLQRYYDQLAAIETKIPISENQVRIPFKWQDAFDKGSLFVGKSTLTLSSNIYERICVLFNIGACCSEMASTQPLDQEDGLKTAAKLYQLAAGAYTFIKDNALTATRQDCTYDLYPDTLNVLISLMLAQAQEIFYDKSIKDKMKDGTVSKIAAQCSDYYADAMKSIQSENLKELQKQWLPTISGKQALYHALSEYHRSLHEENEKNIGIQIARLGKALEVIKISDQRSGKESNVKHHVATIQQAYDKAKKENDYVYHERVPDHKTLPAIERAAIAKVIPVKFPISEDFRDLFVNLVPISVHNGLQTFNAKKMESVNLEIGKLRQASDLLNTALAAWNLPASIEDVSGNNKVPQSVLDKSQIIKDKGGITRIDKMISDLPDLLQRNTEILNETKRILEEEEKSDTELRSQLKDKWTRTPSKQLNESLFSELKQYEQIIENAIKANNTIEEKYKRHRDGVVLLSKSEHEIANSLPAGNPVAALQNTHIIKDLRRLMGEVESLKNVREVLESELKGLDTDSIKAKLISSLQAGAGLDEHAIIQEEVNSILAPLRKQVRENIQEQEKLIGFIEKANTEFCKEKVVNESSKLRDEMLKNLALASDGYNELYNHLEEGSKFYNDLTPILLKIQNKITDFVFARKTEKDDNMKELQVNITRPTSAQPTSSAAPSRPPPPTPSTSQANAPPYPVYNNAYFPQMPSVYYPYSFNNQQPAYPTQTPPGGQYPPYPQQTYPVVPPRKNK